MEEEVLDEDEDDEDEEDDADILMMVNEVLKALTPRIRIVTISILILIAVRNKTTWTRLVRGLHLNDLLVVVARVMVS